MNAMHLDIQFTYPSRAPSDELVREALRAAGGFLAHHNLTVPEACSRNAQAMGDRQERDPIWDGAEQAAFDLLHDEDCEYAMLVAVEGGK